MSASGKNGMPFVPAKAFFDAVQLILNPNGRSTTFLRLKAGPLRLNEVLVFFFVFVKSSVNLFRVVSFLNQTPIVCDFPHFSGSPLHSFLISEKQSPINKASERRCPFSRR
jgi:hypothetical protein